MSRAKSHLLCFMAEFMLCNALSATSDACGYSSKVCPNDISWQLRIALTSQVRRVVTAEQACHVYKEPWGSFCGLLAKHYREHGVRG